MEDRSYWNWFLPIAGCGPPNYECGANFSDNFYSKPDVGNGRWCGLGIACAEYLFDLRNESLPGLAKPVSAPISHSNLALATQKLRGLVESPCSIRLFPVQAITFSAPLR